MEKMFEGALPEVLTIPKAARLCSVTRMTMWRWVKSGLIKASVTPGGHYRIRRPDLETFLIDNRMTALCAGRIDGGRILVVDDAYMIRAVLTRALQDYDFEIETACDGFEAGIQILRFQPDLIVLDLIMPGLDGFEVCRFIRQDPATTHIKILVLTGFDTPLDRDQALAAGADAFLAKPVSQEVLVEQIMTLLGRDKKLRTAATG